MQHQVSSYLNFLLKSKNQHGVHSPFVFDLVTKCFYENHSIKVAKQWKHARKNLISDSSTIEVKDLGAGSRVFASQKRPIKKIAQNAGISFKRAMLLNKLCHYFKVESTLELGTSLGLGSLSMALNNPLKLDTVEGCENTLNRAIKLFETYNCNDQITTHLASFSQFISSLPSNQTYDLIYIDGHHNYQATLHYFDAMLAHAHENTIFIIDDIYWSKGMTKAWESIYQHPKIHVSIDIFYWGIGFLRTQQAKEHFRIRI